jgi:flagellar hook-associated protein 1 FlgK
MSDMGLSIAASGLAAETAELDTASNNMSNINTPGYAAEQVNLSPEAAAGPLGAGQGVIVGSVSELTDAVFEAGNVAAEGVAGAASQTHQVMSSVESIFPEPSTTGIASQLSTLWSDLSVLASNANQVGAEQAVVGAAQSLATSISGSFTQLTDLASSLQSDVGSGAQDGGTLAEANTLLGQVAHLNAGIVAGTAGGQDTNALTDETRAAVDKLASLLGVSASTAPSGSVSVYLNGVQLVAGDVAQTLSTTGSAGAANLGIATGNGVAVEAGGSIGANQTAINSTIPAYQAQLNGVSDSLATTLNGLQANGLAANGDPGAAIAGTWAGTILPNIFVNGGSSSTYTTSPGNPDSAATIAVAPALLGAPGLIATASAPGPTNANVIGTATLDGTNAQAMAAIASAASGPDVLYQSMIGGLGTEAADAASASTTASNLATTASNNLSSISGVDENNEEVDVLAAQNAFQASSQVVSAITSCFQALLEAV